MQLSRRFLLTASGLAVLPGLARAQTPPADPRMADRALGSATAPVTVNEWFSLTCPHCARFSQDVLPQIQTGLIDTGKLRMVFDDFPLDQVALMASMVARSMPVERYEPFCAALLATQDRWAYARGVNTTEELAKMAALAGMPRPTFDAAIADKGLQAAILQRQDMASKVLGVDSTPTFIFDGPAAKGRRESGERSYDEFSKLVASATS